MKRYQVHVRGREPQPLFTVERKARREARALARENQRAVTVTRLDEEGATRLAVYEPKPNAAAPKAGASRGKATLAALLEIRESIKNEVANADTRVSDTVNDVRRDLVAIENSLKNGFRAPTGVDPYQFFVAGSAARLTAALTRRQDAIHTLAWIDEVLEKGGAEVPAEAL